MTETLIPSPYPSSLSGEEKDEGCFAHLDIGSLGFVWDLGFEDWYFN